MKLTITKVFRSDKDKQGNPLKGKDGRPYTKLAIKCVEYGDKWVSGFQGPWNANWKEGDTVEADVEQKGEYLNLKRPDPLAAITKVVNDLVVRVAKLEGARKPTPAEMEEPPEDSPF